MESGGQKKWTTIINSTLTDAQSMDTYKAADVVNLYLPPTLILLGLSLNFLTILVMRSPYFRRVSTSVYLTASAINDVTSLLLSLFPHWLYVNYPGVFRRGADLDGLCAFFNFYGYCNTDVTLILTSLMTVDRAYAIAFPLKVATVNNVRRGRYMVGWGLMMVAMKNFHFLFGSVMSPPDRRERMCIVSPSAARFVFYVNQVWPWIHLVFIAVCFLFIIIGNIFIIVNVKQSATLTDGCCPWKICRRHGNSASVATMRRNSGASHSISAPGRLRHMTSMMLAASFTTVVLSCPFSVYVLVTKKDPDLHKDPAKLALNQLLFSLTFYALYSNKCLNFFLYVVSGYKFRLAFKQLLPGGRLAITMATLCITRVPEGKEIHAAMWLSFLPLRVLPTPRLP